MDEMERMIEELGLEEPSDVPDFASLPTEELLAQFHATERALRERRELTGPRSDEGWELRKLHIAVKGELEKRTEEERKRGHTHEC